MEKEIYTITTLRDDPMIAGRCVGFYFKIEQAIQDVLDNSYDIYEAGYYPYCVIEAVKDGIYSIMRTELWFQWSEIENGYKELPKKPDKFARLVCFGIG